MKQTITIKEYDSNDKLKGVAVKEVESVGAGRATKEKREALISEYAMNALMARI